MQGRIASDITFTGSRKQRVTFEFDGDFRNDWDELNGKELEISAKLFRKKRSLDSNAYAWVLMNKLAEKTHIPVSDVYRAFIKDVGGNCDTVCVKEDAVDKLTTAWERNGIGWVTDIMPSKIKGCKNVILYYGSSTYDTAQMSRLIELIVQHCTDQGIETKTPNEIAEMLSLWENAK